jgi:hypothetical protein
MQADRMAAKKKDSHLVRVTVLCWVVPRGCLPHHPQDKTPSSLSDLGLIYCGKADIGRNFRSISLNSYGYSPQLIENFASIPLSLATIA